MDGGLGGLGGADVGGLGGLGALGGAPEPTSGGMVDDLGGAETPPTTTPTTGEL